MARVLQGPTHTRVIQLAASSWPRRRGGGRHTLSQVVQVKRGKTRLDGRTQLQIIACSAVPVLNRTVPVSRILSRILGEPPNTRNVSMSCTRDTRRENNKNGYEDGEGKPHTCSWRRLLPEITNVPVCGHNQSCKEVHCCTAFLITSVSFGPSPNTDLCAQTTSVSYVRVFIVSYLAPVCGLLYLVHCTWY